MKWEITDNNSTNSYGCERRLAVINISSTMYRFHMSGSYALGPRSLSEERGALTSYHIPAWTSATQTLAGSRPPRPSFTLALRTNYRSRRDRRGADETARLKRPSNDITDIDGHVSFKGKYLELFSKEHKSVYTNSRDRRRVTRLTWAELGVRWSPEHRSRPSSNTRMSLMKMPEFADVTMAAHGLFDSSMRTSSKECSTAYTFGSKAAIVTRS
ncbi:hypothetical protein AG1IA_06919 [Rhizoctonia solani AG-1 IA]|uniref:Uncharacterized protein n=1 Tax=Thanatephorus cucumeris (strain AG1-IA) TaxID=983506 RepID=L8WQK0_THACA|nr:hypothetical protein AG1IA_06919 [Rhizoctonia solani AG-1 IA]